MNEIIVALITGGVTLVGVLISNQKAQAVTETRLDELTREVREHNNFARRMQTFHQGGVFLLGQAVIGKVQVDVGVHDGALADVDELIAKIECSKHFLYPQFDFTQPRLMVSGKFQQDFFCGRRRCGPCRSVRLQLLLRPQDSRRAVPLVPGDAVHGVQAALKIHALC